MQSPEQLKTYQDAATLMVNIIIGTGLFCILMMTIEAIITIRRK